MWTEQSQDSNTWLELSSLAYLLNEDGSKLLTENEGGILLELSEHSEWTDDSIPVTTWT